MYHFEPETLRVLQSVMDDIVTCLPREDCTQDRRILIAQRLLASAAGGERDLARLKLLALGQRSPTPTADPPRRSRMPAGLVPEHAGGPPA